MDIAPPLAPGLPPTPGIIAAILTDTLDALSTSTDPEVVAWVRAVTPLLSRDLYNWFTTNSPVIQDLYNLAPKG